MFEYSDIQKLGLDAAAVLLPLLMALIGAWLRNLIGEARLQKIDKTMQIVKQEIEANKELADAAVIFAQQRFSHFNGETRYNRALEWMLAEARSRGIEIDEDQVRGYIENALVKAKIELADFWENIGK